MRSHFALPRVPRGVAAVCAVAGATAVLNGNCSGAPFIAADYATNSTYASGWAAGQNGGYGWGAWSFDYTGGTSPSGTVMQTMDRGSSPLDPFGTAWTLFTPEGSTPSTAFGSTFTCVIPPTGTDLSRAGRAFPNGQLQPGQTFSTVIANPTGRSFYRGYTIVLATGSDNIQYGNAGIELGVGTFEYFSYGKWYTTETYPNRIPIYDTNTVNGVELDLTMTGTNSYHLVFTPLANPSMAYSEEGTVTNSINWVTYQLYNTDSDYFNVDTNTATSYPTNSPCGLNPTDFYIKSMTVAPLTLNIQVSGPNAILTWPAYFTNNFVLAFATNLVSPVWNTNLPSPVAVNGQNTVTNPIANSKQFYRLQQ